ncbi:MAG: hypothetical protein HY082_06240 [Gammaproteobacteria bacterium]|nr:hypothetical protein [Gammaproteobacteria bacterium]
MKRNLFMALLFLPGVALAADVSVAGKVTAREGDSSVSVVLSNDDRSRVEQYYRRHRESESGRNDDRRYREDRDDDHRHGEHEGHGRGRGNGMPPGLAKRGGDLPPGLAMRDNLPPGLARHDRLPDDVRYEPLPRDLDRQLPPLPSKDYVRVIVGTDLLILNKKTHVVLDIAKVINQ